MTGQICFDLTLFLLRDVSQEHNCRVIAELTVQTKPVVTGASRPRLCIGLSMAIPSRFQNRLSHCVGDPLNLTSTDESYVIHCNNWRHGVFTRQLVKGPE